MCSLAVFHNTPGTSSLTSSTVTKMAQKLVQKFYMEVNFTVLWLVVEP